MLNWFKMKIKRQAEPDSKPYWEEFELDFRPGMNVIIALMDIREKAVTADGRKTTPVAWESSCLEEVCGSCAMLINGVPRQACSTLIEGLKTPITLEPLSKFPVVRDLVVDRSVIFVNFRKVKAWLPMDGTHALGPGPRVSQEQQQEAYPLSRCITCGCCMEACPQFNVLSPFIGPAALNQATLTLSHPTGWMNRSERLSAVRGKGGLGDCGNAQNCARVCPKDIPLVDSIARLNRQAIIDGLKRWMSG